MRRAPARSAIHVAWFPFEFVRNPIDSVRAAFHLDLWPLFCHHPEESITIQDSEWLDACVDRQQWFGPIRLGLQRGVTKPKIERQGDEEDDKGAIVVAAGVGRGS